MISLSEGITQGLEESLKGATGTTTIAFTLGLIIGPPALIA